MDYPTSDATESVLSLCFAEQHFHLEVKWAIPHSTFFVCLSVCYPAGSTGKVLYLTRFFFLLSSFFFFFFFLSGNTSFSHTSLHSILTKLGQSDRYLDHYSGTDNGGVRGHDGVTGVKKVIFTKKASSPTEYLASMRDLRICISLTPSTKVIVLKIHPGSFGVTGVKRSFSLKRHQVLQNTYHWRGTYAHALAWAPLQKL